MYDVIYKPITPVIKKQLHQLTIPDMILIQGTWSSSLASTFRSPSVAFPCKNLNEPTLPLCSTGIEPDTLQRQQKKKSHEYVITRFYVSFHRQKTCQWMQYTVTLHRNIPLFSSLNTKHKVSFWTQHLFVSLRRCLLVLWPCLYHQYCIFFFCLLILNTHRNEWSNDSSLRCKN